MQKFILAFTACVLMLYGPVAFAQMSVIPDQGTASAVTPACNFATGAMSFACIPQYIGYLVKLLLGFAGGFFLFGMMMAGYKYMFGSVTATGTEAGKKEIIGRVVGFAIIVFSYLLVDTLISAMTMY